MACQEVRYAYSAKGMNVYDVPLKPQSGKVYNIIISQIKRTPIMQITDYVIWMNFIMMA